MGNVRVFQRKKQMPPISSLPAIDPFASTASSSRTGLRPGSWSIGGIALHRSELETVAPQETPLQRVEAVPTPQENTTGLPDHLKMGVESLSGLSLDDVQVHYNASQPADVQALAYTQGTQIYVGPGQEQHLAHEAWHVVQQKQGRVQPTIQARGITLNDDQGLEREADIMGDKASSTGSMESSNVIQQNVSSMSGAILPLQHYAEPDGKIVQRQVEWRQQKDNVLDGFVKKLDELVQAGAKMALENPEKLPGADGYTKLWQETAALLIAARDRTLDDQQDLAIAKAAKGFGPARYGYAVEAFVTNSVADLKMGLPDGYTLTLQMTKGMTRPDVVATNNLTREEAWFDITSHKDHIDNKTGAGWKTNPYVAEILFDSLDITNLGTGGLSIAQGVSLRNALKRRLQAWEAFVEGKKKKFLGQWKKEEGDQKSSQKDQKAATEKAMEATFLLDDLKPALVKSLLRSFGLDPKAYGYKGSKAVGGQKVVGDAFLREKQEEELQPA